MQRGLLGLLAAMILSGCVFVSLNTPGDIESSATSEAATNTLTYEIAEPFASYYAASGGRALFGEPISQAMAEDGTLVQYFRNVRLEWDPNAQCVRLSRLGEKLWKTAIVQPINETSQIEGRYYSQPGLTVYKMFLPLYDAKGGPDFYGYPVSRLVVDTNGRYVQYFERVRFDWNPDDPKNAVCLGPLGEVALRGRKPPIAGEISTSATPGAQQTVAPASARVQTQTRATLTAVVKDEMTGMGGNQTVSLRLLDGEGRGVANVSIKVVVHDRKADREYFPPATDADGYTACIFPIGNSPSGYTILVDAIAVYQGCDVTARTSYTPWY